jgi:hypothetical protein
MSQIELNEKDKNEGLEAFDTQHDYILTEHYWSPKYIQHIAQIPHRLVCELDCSRHFSYRRRNADRVLGRIRDATHEQATFPYSGTSFRMLSGE